MLRSSRLSAAAATRSSPTASSLASASSSSSVRLAAGKTAPSPAAFASLARAYATKTGHSFNTPADS